MSGLFLYACWIRLTIYRKLAAKPVNLHDIEISNSIITTMQK